MSSEKDKFRAARLHLIRMYVFFGSIAMMLELVEDETLKHPAATNGKQLIFNPNLTKDWTFGETIAVVCHEVLHVILLHHLRRGSRIPKKWNVAVDYVVNGMLKTQLGEIKGPIKAQLPAGTLYSPEYIGMNAEEVYARLPDSDAEQQQQGFDDVMDGGENEQELKEQEGRIKAAIQNAAQLARKAGQMSGSLERLVEAVCEPKAGWRSIIRDYLTERAEVDYNWAKPHQRMLSQFGIIYPTLDGERLGKIAMLVDASGSCYNDQEQFCSEVSDILAAYECEVDVIFHDSKVTAVDHYTSDDLPIVMRPHGFGGTDASAAYKYASELDPDLIISLTDLELSFSNVEVPTCDVIIACSRKEYFRNCPKWARLIDIS